MSDVEISVRRIRFHPEEGIPTRGEPRNMGTADLVVRHLDSEITFEMPLVGQDLDEGILLCLKTLRQWARDVTEALDTEIREAESARSP